MKNVVFAAAFALGCPTVIALAFGMTGWSSPVQNSRSPAPSTNTCAVPNQPVAVVRCEPATIYVSDFDRSAIEKILSRHFDGFTILPARGCWRETCENSLVIQVVGASEAAVRKAAEDLRLAGKQQQVIVVIPEVPHR